MREPSEVYLVICTQCGIRDVRTVKGIADDAAKDHRSEHYYDKGVEVCVSRYEARK